VEGGRQSDGGQEHDCMHDITYVGQYGKEKEPYPSQKERSAKEKGEGLSGGQVGNNQRRE